ncbi:MAG TPA: bifunctional diaminohydroxyphosphoribosylaminopyrimidine deaminase/5-amino-6-(5-phosphoribosylamino)uracil reductase RibD [Devosia sp.]|nr:bifunctional diaminohydroxyphosphoribosylaminopyrimidine deaminase/5-amino-6-(5-phosphoribosylamino)uracil reductase RibD [Devosia sp.]
MSVLSPEDGRWLDAAARYAAPFVGTTADNPAVAALVVDPRSQTLVARAVTARGGRPHAEAEALARAGFEAAGCTLYVTLEPCHHWGRTPPCVQAIIRSGIMRVVIGASDPDARSAGGTVKQLESAGIETLLAEHGPSQALHAGHISRHAAGRPFVTAVMHRCDEAGSPASGSEAQRWVNMLRTRSDAVLLGAATTRHLDHGLSVALPGLAGRTPLRVVLVGASGIDRSVNLIGDFSGYRTAVIAETNAKVDVPVSVETIRIDGKNGRPDLHAALRALAARSIQSLLVEPGPRLAAAILKANLVDRFAVIRRINADGDAGPAADLPATAGLAEVHRQTLGDDELTLYERSVS